MGCMPKPPPPKRPWFVDFLFEELGLFVVLGLREIAGA
jgi:hypothetical protein